MRVRVMVVLLATLATGLFGQESSVVDSVEGKRFSLVPGSATLKSTLPWDFGREELLFKDALYPSWKHWRRLEYSPNVEEKVVFVVGYFAPLAYGFVKGGNAKYTAIGLTVASGGIIPSVTGYLFRWVYRVFDPPKKRYQKCLEERIR